jgi:hypothetical protein
VTAPAEQLRGAVWSLQSPRTAGGTLPETVSANHLLVAQVGGGGR